MLFSCLIISHQSQYTNTSLSTPWKICKKNKLYQFSAGEEENLAAISAPAARRNTQFGSFFFLFLYISNRIYIYIWIQALNIFGKEAHGHSHTQSCLKSQESKKLRENKMAFHHIHNQNIRHTHSFVVTGKKSQCSDVVWLQRFMIKTMTIGLILHPVGLDVRGEDQTWLHFSLVY